MDRFTKTNRDLYLLARLKRVCFQNSVEIFPFWSTVNQNLLWMFQNNPIYVQFWLKNKLKEGQIPNSEVLAPFYRNAMTNIVIFASSFFLNLPKSEIHCVLFTPLPWIQSVPAFSEIEWKRCSVRQNMHKSCSVWFRDKITSFHLA